MAGFLRLKKAGAPPSEPESYSKYFFMINPAAHQLQWFNDSDRTALEGTLVIDADTKVKTAAELGLGPTSLSPTLAFHIFNTRTLKKIVCIPASESERRMWFSTIEQLVPEAGSAFENDTSGSNSNASADLASAGSASTTTPQAGTAQPVDEKAAPAASDSLSIIRALSAFHERLLHRREAENQERKNQGSSRELMIRGLKMSSELLVEKICQTVQQIDTIEDATANSTTNAASAAGTVGAQVRDQDPETIIQDDEDPEQMSVAGVLYVSGVLPV